MNHPSLFDFAEPDGSKLWVTTPGTQSAFPISIHNNTADGHEVAVRVEEPANWGWATPERISLDPGAATTVSVILFPRPDTLVAAGTHMCVLRLRDLEGVIFAECRHVFEIQERQELAMTVTLRGPLMSFGRAEGVVLHCTLANRGNVDVAVTPVGDPHPTLTFSKRTVQVPFQGEASFDIEVRWNAARRLSHPDIVTLRALYRNGEASASIEWSKIAEALERFMPIYSTRAEEDEVLSLSWMPNPEASKPKPLSQSVPAPVAVSDPPAAATDPPAAPIVRSPVVAEIRPPAKPESSTPPTAVAVSVVKHPPNVTAIVTTTAAEPAAEHATVAQVRRPHDAPAPAEPSSQPSFQGEKSLWWPVVQRSGRRWRIKALPILMALIVAEGLAIGWQAHYGPAKVSDAGGKVLSVVGNHRLPAAALSNSSAHANARAFGHATTARAALSAHHTANIAQHKTSAKPHASTGVKAKQAAAPTPSPTQPSTQPKASVKRKAASQAMKPAQPFSALPVSLSGLSAYYAEPHLLVVSFVRTNVRNVRLTVHDGSKVIFDRRGFDGHTATIHLAPHIKRSLLISVVGSSPGGSVLFRQMWMYRPPWL